VPEQAAALNVPAAEALLEAMSEAVYAVDTDRRVTYWNPAAERLTGYKASDVVGRRCRDNILSHVDDKGTVLCTTGCPLLATIEDGRARKAHVFLRHRDGHRVPVAVRAAALCSADGAVTGAVEVFHDDSRLQAVADRLDLAEHEALTDPLTGVANRRMLERALGARENEQQRHDRGYAVVFCDVDNFKGVNDDCGYEAGDRVLRAVAQALQGSTRPSDTVGRWGGDEFLVVVPAAGQAQAVLLAERMRKVVAALRALGDHDTAVTLSAGVAVACWGEPSAQVVARASRAMRDAKDNGGDRTRADREPCDGAAV
jgi:diguanylate cyclase (GGDEF)-like protein/PAS domain S-box-containing protein